MNNNLFAPDWPVATSNVVKDPVGPDRLTESELTCSIRMERHPDGLSVHAVFPPVV